MKEPGKCRHPARNGWHEEYARPDGSSFCRACGVEITPPEGPELTARKWADFVRALTDDKIEL